MATLELDTPRFGPIAPAEESVIEFPGGLIGLSHCRRFARLPFADPALPFEWLQCLDDVSIAFLTADPQAFFPEYAVQVAPEELQDIALANKDDGEVRCIITMPEQVAAMTANLLAPIIVNTRSRLAKQVVLGDPQYATKHRLFPEAESHADSQPPA